MTPADSSPPNSPPEHADLEALALRLAISHFSACVEAQRAGRRWAAARLALATGRALLLLALQAPLPDRR